MIDATFERVDLISGDAELLSDFARYLSVLVSGFLEKAVVELIFEYVRRHSHPTVQQHIEQKLRKFTNAKVQKLLDLVGSFDADWRTDLEAYLVDEFKDAVNGIVDIRNNVAHGGSTGVTIVRVKNYYVTIKQVVNHIAEFCAPEP